LDVSSVIKKIKIAYDMSTNAQLADYFQISVAAIDSWRRQKKVPEKYITKCMLDTGVSFDWLLDEDKPTFHISGGSKNISQVNGGVGIQENKEDELELYEEFKKVENLAKMANKIDFLKDELEKIKEELKQHI
jgi:endo-1,4-beta-D-glucanase Y